MARVNFTQAIQRHISVPAMEVSGRTVREVLEAVFEVHAQARGYVLDDQGMLRQHMVVFVDGEPIEDRDGQSDPVGPNAEVFVMQALSGG